MPWRVPKINDLSGRGTTRAEDARGSHILPSIRVYEDHTIWERRRRRRCRRWRRRRRGNSTTTASQPRFPTPKSVVPSLYIYLSFYLSIYLFIYLFISVYLYRYICICLYIYVSIYLYMFVSIPCVRRGGEAAEEKARRKHMDRFVMPWRVPKMNRGLRQWYLSYEKELLPRTLR